MNNSRIQVPHPYGGPQSFLGLLDEALRHRGWMFQYDYPPDPDRVEAATWIHWPEQLTNYQFPTPEDLDRIGRWLEAASRAGTVLWTVHNTHRHGMPDHPGFNALYRMTAERADVQLHLARTSIGLVQRLFPEARPREVLLQPFGDLSCMIGPRTRQEARRELGLGEGPPILLAAGTIRADPEYRMVLRAAAWSGWRVLTQDRRPYVRRRHRVQVWIERRLAGGRLVESCRRVPEPVEDQVVKACDAVFVPRPHNLNSASVYLGFTFGRAVIGPDLGNIGEVLRATGNPTFRPSFLDLIRVLRRSRSLDLEELGRRNAAWVAKNGRWEDAAQVALTAIESLTRGESVTR